MVSSIINPAHTVTFEEFDTDKLTFSTPAINRKGGQQVYLKYDKRRGDVAIQTPVLTTLFGARKWEDDNGTSASISLSMTRLPGDDEADVAMASAKFDKLDAKILNHGQVNGEILFDKFKTKAAILDNYNKLVKTVADQWVDQVKFKIPLNKDGTPAIDLFDEAGTRYDSVDVYDKVSAESKVQLIFKMSVVYFFPRASWGLSLAVKAIRFIRQENTPNIGSDPAGYNQFVLAFTPPVTKRGVVTEALVAPQPPKKRLKPTPVAKEMLRLWQNCHRIRHQMVVQIQCSSLS